MVHSNPAYTVIPHMINIVTDCHGQLFGAAAHYKTFSNRTQALRTSSAVYSLSLNTASRAQS